MSNENIQWTVSPHAKQRAWERYGIKFSPRKWSDFCRSLQKAKNLIRLKNSGSEGCRFACCFQGQWFFIGCNLHRGRGMISTFLPADALTETDKTILASDDRYAPIGDAPWNAVRQKLPGRRAVEKHVSLSNIQVAQDELPPDFDQISNLLKTVSPQCCAKTSDDS